MLAIPKALAKMPFVWWRWIAKMISMNKENHVLIIANRKFWTTRVRRLTQEVDLKLWLTVLVRLKEVKGDIKTLLAYGDEDKKDKCTSGT